MKFLPAGERVELALSKSKTSGRRAKRQVQVEFVMKLDGTRIARIAPFIAHAWKSMKLAGSGMVLTDLNRMIESQNVRFYTLPKDEDVAPREEVARMEAVDLAGVRLEKIPTGEILLYFRAVQPMSKVLWDWLFYAEQAESIFAEFEECQTEMLKVETTITINEIVQ